MLLPPAACPLAQVFAPFIDVGLYPTPRLLDFYEVSAAAACTATAACLHS